MNRSYPVILRFLLFIILFVLIQPLVDWMLGGEISYTKEGIIDAVFIGIMLPIIILIHVKIKQTWLYIVLAMLAMALVFSLKYLIFQ